MKAATDDLKSDLSKALSVLEAKIEGLRRDATNCQQAGDSIFYAAFNFDIKNPHVGEVISHDPDELLADYAKQLQSIHALRNELRAVLSAALSNNSAEGV